MADLITRLKRKILTDSFWLTLARVRGNLWLDHDRAVSIFGLQDFFYQAFLALSFAGVDGDYAEFGCYGATTFTLAYRQARRRGYPLKMWAFDSFQGIPSSQSEQDARSRFQPGTMRMSVAEFHDKCRSRGIPRANYAVVEGWYADTLDHAKPDAAPSNICLAFVDCDLYSSATSVMRFLLPRMKHGMIIAFDDYFCWTESQISGERWAMLDAFEGNQNWRLVPFLKYHTHGVAFVVEKTQ